MADHRAVPRCARLCARSQRPWFWTRFLVAWLFWTPLSLSSLPRSPWAALPRRHRRVAPEALTMVCAGAWPRLPPPPQPGRGAVLGWALKAIRVGLWAPSGVWVSSWQSRVSVAERHSPCHWSQFPDAWVFCCIRLLLGVLSLSLL